ncbi:MAG: hypothetical protein V7L01_21140 [Nostoc sp.]|uniref:hypothetical protein n=1 Tax=Nostoc sp. TaxID=1180 RepID=UPI002FF93303
MSAICLDVLPSMIPHNGIAPRAIAVKIIEVVADAKTTLRNRELSMLGNGRSCHVYMRKSGNTIAIQAMRHGRKKDVREFEKPNCNARGAAIA